MGSYVDHNRVSCRRKLAQPFCGVPRRGLSEVLGWIFGGGEVESLIILRTNYILRLLVLDGSTSFYVIV